MKVIQIKIQIIMHYNSTFIYETTTSMDDGMICPIMGLPELFVKEVRVFSMNSI